MFAYSLAAEASGSGSTSLPEEFLAELPPDIQTEVLPFTLSSDNFFRASFCCVCCFELLLVQSCALSLAIFSLHFVCTFVVLFEHLRFWQVSNLLGSLPGSHLEWKLSPKSFWQSFQRTSAQRLISVYFFSGAEWDSLPSRMEWNFCSQYHLMVASLFFLCVFVCP